VPADETCCSMRQRDPDRFSAMNETDITRLCRDPGPLGVRSDGNPQPIAAARGAVLAALTSIVASQIAGRTIFASGGQGFKPFSSTTTYQQVTEHFHGAAVDLHKKSLPAPRSGRQLQHFQGTRRTVVVRSAEG